MSCAGKEVAANERLEPLALYCSDSASPSSSRVVATPTTAAEVLSAAPLITPPGTRRGVNSNRAFRKKLKNIVFKRGRSKHARNKPSLPCDEQHEAYVEFDVRRLRKNKLPRHVIVAKAATDDDAQVDEVSLLTVEPELQDACGACRLDVEEPLEAELHARRKRKAHRRSRRHYNFQQQSIFVKLYARSGSGDEHHQEQSGVCADDYYCPSSDTLTHSCSSYSSGRGEYETQQAPRSRMLASTTPLASEDDEGDTSLDTSTAIPVFDDSSVWSCRFFKAEEDSDILNFLRKRADENGSMISSRAPPDGLSIYTGGDEVVSEI